MRTIVCLVLALIPTFLMAQVAVVREDLKASQIDRDRFRDIVLGRITTWNDGTPIILVLVEEEQAALALDEVAGRSLPQLLRGWKRLVYAGNGAMPLIRDSADAALRIVDERRGAIAVLATAPANMQGYSILYPAQ